MEKESNNEHLGLSNLVRLASYTFILGAVGAYGFYTASELGMFSKWPYLEKLFNDPNAGMAVGVLVGVLWAKIVNQHIAQDTSGWAWEERFRVFLYAGIGSVIGLFVAIFMADRFFPGSQNIPVAPYIVFIFGPVVGALVGGWWATLINRDVRGRGVPLPPLTDEEFERLVKAEEAKMDENGNYLPQYADEDRQ